MAGDTDKVRANVEADIRTLVRIEPVYGFTASSPRVLAQKSNRPWDRFADEACGRRFLMIRPKR